MHRQATYPQQVDAPCHEEGPGSDGSVTHEGVAVVEVHAQRRDPHPPQGLERGKAERGIQNLLHTQAIRPRLPSAGDGI